MLLIDAANVIGSRPTGWWKDRPGAARAFVERVRAATTQSVLVEPVLVVLEGQFRAGVQPGTVGGVAVLHAPGTADDKLMALIAEATGPATLVSADRALRQRASEFGVEVAGPGWFTHVLEGAESSEAGI